MSSKKDIPHISVFMAVILKLIAKLEVVKSPRKLLPPLVKAELHLTAEAAAVHKKNGSLLYADRTGWSLTYLKKAGLIDFPWGGQAKITSRGESFLKADEIKIKDLLQFPEFAKFYYGKKALIENNLINPMESINKATDNSAVEILIESELLFNLLKAMPTISLTNINGKLTMIRHHQ